MSRDKVWRAMTSLSDGFWLAGGVALLFSVIVAVVGRPEDTPMMSDLAIVFSFVGFALGMAAWLYRRGVTRDQSASRVAAYRAEVAPSKVGDQ